MKIPELAAGLVLPRYRLWAYQRSLVSKRERTEVVGEKG